MKGYITLFISGREGFFVEEACTNCSVNEFRVCDNVDALFDIDGILRKKCVDVGMGIMISESLKVERDLIYGQNISLSHKGILSICSHWREEPPNYVVQFTDLNTNKQAEVVVEKDSISAFYDDKVLMLTMSMHMQETNVEEVFNEKHTPIFKEVSEAEIPYPWTDTTLLHKTRVLYYWGSDKVFYKFNVDNRTNTKVDVGMEVWGIPSVTGIDCGVRVVFSDSGVGSVYTLNLDNSVTEFYNEFLDSYLIATLPSESDPKNVGNAAFRYDNYLLRNGKIIDIRHVVNLDFYCTIIRIYRDVFMVYDENVKGWALIRITVS